ncbi:MAG: hypothetical protein QW702_04720 [Candidatus Bathyarchaeia archaeon]
MRETIGEYIEKVKNVFKHYSIDGEIIVSDNSSDETPEIARSLGLKLLPLIGGVMAMLTYMGLSMLVAIF